MSDNMQGQSETRSGRRAPSPPTERALDVIELLAQRSGTPVKFVDIARDLSLTQGTAHAILSALVARRWALQDSTTKSYSIGPALATVAGHGVWAGAYDQVARTAAHVAADELGYPSTVVQLAGDSLMIVATAGGLDQRTGIASGDRLPFVAPFGPAFAAWMTADEQRSWIESGFSPASTAARDLAEFLSATRARGYTIERTSRVLMRAGAALVRLHREPVSVAMRDAMAAVMAEIADTGFLAGSGRRPTEPVTSIAAPVFDRAGTAVLNVALHPLQPLTARQIETAGRVLTNIIADASEEAA